MARDVSVGVIGAGGMAQIVHLPILKRLPEVEVTAIIDTQEGKAQTIAERFGVPFTARSLGELPSDASLDAVLVSTPNDAHAGVVRDALERGKHVLCERPLAPTSEATEELIRAAEAAERSLALEADIRELAFEPCQAVTLNWVLQFLPSADRLRVLRRLHASLATGGMLILSEKVRSDDPGTEAFNQATHLDFKRANGYSELEISQKRSALEQVMITDSVEQHRARLEEAGFAKVRLWYQCLNWASFVATR